MKYHYTKHPNANPTAPWAKRPLVRTTLFGPAGSIRTVALIDSGADYSLFNIAFAHRIGVDLSQCEEIPTMGIAGSLVPVYVIELALNVEQLDRITVPVVFIDSENVTGLLGQEGFFDQNRIKFERDHDVFEITPVAR